MMARLCYVYFLFNSLCVLLFLSLPFPRVGASLYVSGVHPLRMCCSPFSHFLRSFFFRLSWKFQNICLHFLFILLFTHIFTRFYLLRRDARGRRRVWAFMKNGTWKQPNGNNLTVCMCITRICGHIFWSEYDGNATRKIIFNKERKTRKKSQKNEF